MKADTLSLLGFGSSGSSLSPESASPPCSNKTNLLPGRGITADGRCVTDELVVTSSMGMLHRVHGNTTHLRPAVPLHAGLVVGIASLEKGLLSPTPTGNLSNHHPATSWYNLLRSRWKLDPASMLVNTAFFKFKLK